MEEFLEMVLLYESNVLVLGYEEIWEDVVIFEDFMEF